MTFGLGVLKIRAHFCQLRFGIFAKTQVILVNISTGRMKL